MPAKHGQGTLLPAECRGPRNPGPSRTKQAVQQVSPSLNHLQGLCFAFLRWGAKYDEGEETR